MNISFNYILPIFNIKNNYREKHNNLVPLKQDVISFKAMKKSQLKGIDLIIANKFSNEIPLADKWFSSNADLQEWCKKKLEKEYLNNDFYSKYPVMNEWIEFCKDKNNDYSFSEKLLIIEGIAKGLKWNTYTPEFNKSVLDNTIIQIKKISETNPKFDAFKKLYIDNLNKVSKIMQTLDENKTGWIIIPSKLNDSENFNSNVKALMRLSHHNWCTAKDMADIYLEQGDFHIYMENGKPKLGVRFKANEIQEIQGEENNKRIPVRYFNEAKKHAEGYERNNYTANQFISFLVKQAKCYSERQLSEELFKALGTFEKKDNNGLIILKSYNSIYDEFNDSSWEELEINEDKLLKYVKEIKGDAKFSSKLTKPENLKKIGGNAFIGGDIKNLGPLEKIGGNACFSSLKLTNLGKLKEIGGNADFRNSKINSLKKLEKIGKDVFISNSKITKQMLKNVDIGGEILI